VQALGFNFFEGVPDDCLMRVMEFLDPYSFVSFSRVSLRINGIARSEALGDYYKSLCLKLFRPFPVLLPG
jgi:hypothetical protein